MRQENINWQVVDHRQEPASPIRTPWMQSFPNLALEEPHPRGKKQY